MMSLWDALRMNMMISYQELVRTFPKRKNLESNLKAQNLQLDAEDKKAIAALDCNDRLVSPEGLAPEWD
ncbi:hypothetical protein H0P17_22495 [Escherichia coli]|nr:hypothetical protein [Escherichia coli]NZB57087.1 hypothetical protein [Escherichia coli]